MVDSDQEGLSVSGLRKALPRFVIEADFKVRPGERAAILGPSGVGKSTLLRIIAGLEPPGQESCSILLDGTELARLPPEKRGVGFVFQDQALFSGMTVLENAAFGLRMRGVPRARAEAECLPWLDRLGMSPLESQSVLSLSGGEKQRLAFVRALVWKPKLLLLDEPFSALDASLRVTLRKELLELHRLWPVPLILVTHDESDLSALATLTYRFREIEGGRRRVLESLS